MQTGSNEILRRFTVSSYASAMSRLSNRLRDIIDTVYQGNSAKFSEAAGLNQSTISRIIRDLFQAHSGTIATMAEHLPTEQAASLCAAWMEDLVPPQLIYAVRISLSHEGEAMILRDAPKTPWADCDQQTRTALDELAALSIRSPEARDALISAAAFVRGDTPLSSAAQTALAVAESRAQAKRRPRRANAEKPGGQK